MAWTDALLAGGFALAGAGSQQFFTWRIDQRKRMADNVDRYHQEQHLALVDLVKCGRRVQRALVDCHERRSSDPELALGREIDRLSEAVAVLRLVVTDPALYRAAADFESHAKKIQRDRAWGPGQPLQLTPVINAAHEYEERVLQLR